MFSKYKEHKLRIFPKSKMLYHIYIPAYIVAEFVVGRDLYVHKNMPTGNKRGMTVGSK